MASKKRSKKPTMGGSRTTASSSVADEKSAGKRDSSNPTEDRVYFWRETDPYTGYLSQWYQCAFHDDEGKTYKSAEHYMMHHKALLFGDKAIALEVLRAGSPRKAKGLVLKVSNFDDAVWDAHKERVVRQGNYFKFTKAINEEDIRLSNSPEAGLVGMSLRDLLLSTGEKELVEASPFDRIWGIGFTAADAETSSRELWGLNLLGKALMEVRDMFKKEDEDK